MCILSGKHVRYYEMIRFDVWSNDLNYRSETSSIVSEVKTLYPNCLIVLASTYYLVISLSAQLAHESACLN